MYSYIKKFFPGVYYIFGFIAIYSFILKLEIIKNTKLPCNTETITYQ